MTIIGSSKATTKASEVSFDPGPPTFYEPSVTPALDVTAGVTATVAPGVRYSIDSLVPLYPGQLSVGFVTKGLAMGHWYLLQKGICRWHVCGSFIVLPHRTAPAFHSHGASNVAGLARESPVSLVIYLGLRPSAEIFRVATVNLIIWVLPSTHRHRRMTLDPSWTTDCHPVCHADIGGVTSAKYKVYVATRGDSSVVFQWSPSSFSNTLGQVLDPTLSGKKISKTKVNDSGRNAPNGLLDWPKGSKDILAPSVFARDHWVRRSIGPKELANALDVPADAFSAILSKADYLKGVLVPGKVISLVMAGVALQQHDQQRGPYGTLDRGGDSATTAQGSETIAVVAMEAASTNEVPMEVQGPTTTTNEGPTEVQGPTSTTNEVETRAAKPASTAATGSETDAEPTTTTTTTISDAAMGAAKPAPTMVAALHHPAGYQGPTGYKLICGDRDSVISAKATKSDDAGVPENLWDQAAIDKLPWFKVQLEKTGSAVLGYRVKRVFRNLRKWMLHIWKEKVVLELDTWMKIYGPHLPNLPKAQKVVEQIRNHVKAASWWNWDGGSTLFFWRWPIQYMSEALYGIKPTYIGDKPRYFVRQPPYNDPVNRERVKEKVAKVMERGYLVSAGPDDVVESLMYMFDVPKGEEDIRMVYDGSKSGLNDALWAPWFPLPTAQSFFDVMMPNYFCSDNDMGDFFLNFPMHEELQMYCGVDVTGLFPLTEMTDDELRKLFPLTELTDDELTQLHIAIWQRCGMGIKNSPHIATLVAGRSNRMILGSRTDQDNPFAWELVVLNLPGTDSYDSTKPWMFKCRMDGKVASDSKRFVDDLRNSGHTKELAWEASTKIGKTCSWLGQQDAPRKRRPPSQTPGAWAATVVATIDGKLHKSVTQEAWDKAKKRLRYLAYYAGCDIDPKLVDFDIEKELKQKPKSKGFLIHKAAEKYRGYLIHISATYDAIVPYLKGLHLTLDGWREGRDDEGWKDLAWYKYHRLDGQASYQEDAPTWVKCVPRFKSDMDVLLKLFDAETPHQLPLRPTCHGTMYIIGDASGTGFGNTAWSHGDKDIDAQFGGWNEETQGESSNFREALTAVNGLEDQLKKGKLQKGCEVFIVTDNWVTERVFENGTASAQKLHDLVVRLREMQMRGDIFVRVLWMAGTRMILQGTDSLSRGDLCSGVMAGDPFLHHVPMSESASDLQPNLIDWFMKALPKKSKWNLLDPTGWFTEAFEDPEGCFIWVPPPALARQAIDCLCDIHHIHPYSSHIVVVPSLMTGHWRKRLGKCSDVVFVIKSECHIWPKHLHEPLTIAFIAPQLREQPWRLGRSDWLEKRQPRMREMLSQNSKTAGRSVRQFWNEAFRLRGTMPQCLAPSVLLEAPGRWIPCAGGPRFGGFDRR